MNNIAKIRKSKGFTQKQVAIELNVSCPTISDWEKGKKNPNHSNLLKLAQLFSVSIDYLLGIDTENSVDEQLLDAAIEADHKLLQLYGNPYQAKKTEERILRERPVSDADLKFAIFGDANNITDAQFEEVKRFAQFIRERDSHDK